MKKVIRATVFIVVFLSAPVSASTDFEINYLTATPVSKLDWGVFHLMQKLNNYRINNKDNPQVFVAFEENEKIILIDGRIDKLGKTLNEAKKLCSETVKNIKSDLGVEPNTSKPYQGKNSDLYFYFGIYNTKIPPKSLPSWLDRNTRISAKVFYEKDNNVKPRESIGCTSKLTNPKILYGK